MEVDQHVAAEDQLKLVEHPVVSQRVVVEQDVFAIARFDLQIEAVVAQEVVVPLTSAFHIVGAVLLQLLARKQAALGLLQHVAVDVGGEDLALLQHPQFVEQHRQGVDLFAGGAARRPDLHPREAVQVGQYPFAQHAELMRVAEKGGDVDGELQEEALETLRLGEQLAGQFEETAAVAQPRQLVETTLHRALLVAAEVVAVAHVERLQQQIDEYRSGVLPADQGGGEEGGDLLQMEEVVVVAALPAVVGEHAGIHAVAALLHDHRRPLRLEALDPLHAVPAVAAQQHPDGLLAVLPGDALEQCVQGGTGELLLAVAGEVDLAVSHLQVVARRGDVDGGRLDLHQMVGHHHRVVGA